MIDRLRQSWNTLSEWTRTIGCLQFMIACILLSVACISFGVSLIGQREIQIEELLLNLGSEMLGAFVTFVLLDLMLQSQRKRDEQEHSRRYRRKLNEQKSVERARKEAERKKRLRIETCIQLKQAEEPEVRNSILDKMRQFDLFNDANLSGAKLEFAPLIGVSMRNANFWNANLKHARFNYSDLRGSHIKHADLENANLDYANLKDSMCWYANFSGASLKEADLEGVEFYDKDWKKLPEIMIEKLLEQERIVDNGKIEAEELRLLGEFMAQTWHAVFNENTTLPDGTKWNINVDMRRYTDRNHTDFWRSKDRNSPAYPNSQ